jgi:hypothetical protein
MTQPKPQSHAMKKKSRLAVLSFVLGCSGAWCALTGWFPLVAIPLGLAAVCTGGVALSLTGKPAAQRRGRRLAVAAVCLGVAAIVSGVALMIGQFLQQFSSEHGGRQNWDQIREAEAIQGRKRMPDKPAAQFTSNLPIAVLGTAGQSVAKDPPTVVRARFFDVENGRASLAAKPVYDGLATVHLRGYTTLHLPKPSYTFHTVDNQTNQTKVSLLGLPKEADWVLYAPYEDKSLIRDVLAYELANKMGHYAPRTRYLELFVQDSERPLSMRDYAGIYVLVEKIKRGKDRVNVAKLEPQNGSEPEIAGGYIVKRDHSERAESRFRTRHGGPYFYVYPKAAAITPEQKRWLTRYLNSFESALYGSDFADPHAGYAAYLDVGSFIDAHWLVEMSKNVDGFRYSAFLTKDRGGKLKPEPPWDWNRSFGNANYYGGGQPRGWYWTNLRPNEISWYRRLREDPEFAARCTRRWFELRRDVFDPKKINARIDQLAAQLAEAQQRNFRRWPVLGRQITCNSYVGQSYQAEVQWLKKWIEHRIAWIDGQLDGSVPVEPQGG